jgi:hypothetical protein
LKKGNILHVNLIEKDYITLGGKGLCFSDSQLIKAASTGLGFPRLSSLAFNFTNGIKSLLMLLKIKKILKAVGSSSQSAAVGLRAGLAGAAVFANNDSRCKELLKGEGSGVALFEIAILKSRVGFHFLKTGIVRSVLTLWNVILQLFLLSEIVRWRAVQSRVDLII